MDNFGPTDAEQFSVRYSKDRDKLQDVSKCDADYAYPSEETANKFAKGVAESGRFAAVVSTRRGILAVYPVDPAAPALEDKPPSSKIKGEAEKLVQEFASELPTPASEPVTTTVGDAIKTRKSRKPKDPETPTVEPEPEPHTSDGDGAKPAPTTIPEGGLNEEDPKARARENYRAALESSQSEQGRAFWQAKIDELDNS